MKTFFDDSSLSNRADKTLFSILLFARHAHAARFHEIQARKYRTRFQDPNTTLYGPYYESINIDKLSTVGYWLNLGPYLNQYRATIRARYMYT